MSEYYINSYLPKKGMIEGNIGYGEYKIFDEENEMNWQKKDFIEGILEELKANNKIIKDIKFIIRREQIKYWVTWAEFISPKVKIKSYDTIDWIIVGNNWWIDRQYEGQDEDMATWNFRTIPTKPKNRI